MQLPSGPHTKGPSAKKHRATDHRIFRRTARKLQLCVLCSSGRCHWLTYSTTPDENDGHGKLAMFLETDEVITMLNASQPEPAIWPVVTSPHALDWHSRSLCAGAGGGARRTNRNVTLDAPRGVRISKSCRRVALKYGEKGSRLVGSRFSFINRKLVNEAHSYLLTMTL
ncbi:hypothetical protein VTI74DRAFT_959 [Chaetomium olivicolor]